MQETGMNPTAHAAKPTPPPGYDPTAEFVNVSPERFTQVPKESHRPGEHKLSSLLGVGVLTLYLSNKTGWKIPNAETLATQWDESADRIRKAIADMERAGWLVRFNEQTDRGRWVTRTFVSSDVKALDPYRRYKAEMEAFRVAQGKPAKGSKAPKNAAPTQRRGEFSQVAPDVTFRDPVNRDPVDRDPVNRDAAVRNPVTGHLKDQETKRGDQKETREEKKDQNPPLSDQISTPAERDPEPEGGIEDSQSKPGSDSVLLTEAVENALSIRPSWKRQDVIAAMRAALDAQFPPAQVAERIVIEADNPDTQYPGRLLPSLRGVTGGRVGSDKPAFVPASTRGKPRCDRGVAHQPFDRDNCPICATERAEAATGVDDLGAMPAHAEGMTAREIALALAAQASSKRSMTEARS